MLSYFSYTCARANPLHVNIQTPQRVPLFGVFAFRGSYANTCASSSLRRPYANYTNYTIAQGGKGGRSPPYLFSLSINRLARNRYGIAGRTARPPLFVNSSPNLVPASPIFLMLSITSSNRNGLPLHV